MTTKLSTYGADSEEQRNTVMFVCACPEEHEYTAQSIVDSMKDSNNQDGQQFLDVQVKLANSSPETK